MAISYVTKKTMAVSLKRLLSSRPLNQITVKNIVEDCGFKRQTFYYHFQDLFGLLEWTFLTEAVDEIEKNILKTKPLGSWQKSYEIIYTYILQNKEFCLNSFHSFARPQMDAFLYRITYKLVFDAMQARGLIEGQVQSEIKFAADYVSYVLISFLVAWLQEGMTQEPAVLIGKLSEVLQGDVKKLLAAGSKPQPM